MTAAFTNDDSVLSRRAVLLALAVIVAVGAFIRLYDVRHSLWLDELHTSWCVADGFEDIAPRARMGNYSPVYFWLVWGVTKVFGLTELAVRLPSLIAGIALIPAVYLFARRFSGSTAAGLLAATLVALDGTLFGWYSQEARSYALIQLLSVLQVWVFYELVHQPKWKLRVAFIAITMTMFYLHYTSVLIVTGELAWYALRRVWLGATRSNARDGQLPVYDWLQLGQDLTIAAMSCLFGAVIHLGQIFERRDQWEQFVTARPIYSVFTLYSLSLPTIVLVIVAGVASYFLRRFSGNQNSPGPCSSAASVILLLACWVMVPLVLTWLMTSTKVVPLFFPRYVLFTTAALPVAAAFGTALFCGWYTRAAYFLAAVLTFQLTPAPSQHFSGAVAGYCHAYSFTQHFSEDWREAVAEIRRRDPEGRFPVFLGPGLIESERLSSRILYKTERLYLLFPVSGIYSLDDGRQLKPLGGAELFSFLFFEGPDTVAKTKRGWLLLRIPPEQTRRWWLPRGWMVLPGFRGVTLIEMRANVLAVETGDEKRQLNPADGE